MCRKLYGRQDPIIISFQIAIVRQFMSSFETIMLAVQYYWSQHCSVQICCDENRVCTFLTNHPTAPEWVMSISSVFRREEPEIGHISQMGPQCINWKHVLST